VPVEKFGLQGRREEGIKARNPSGGWAGNPLSKASARRNPANGWGRTDAAPGMCGEEKK